MALDLKKMGIANVRPLKGGFFAWREKGLPLVRPETNLTTGRTPQDKLVH